MTTLGGRIENVFERRSSSYLASDAAAADTTLSVGDVDAFDEDGGDLVLRDDSHREKVAYTGIDVDLDEVTGVDARVNDFDAGARAYAAPRATVRYAMVALDDQDEAVQVRVPYHLYPWLPLGARNSGDSNTEPCIILYDSEEYYLLDVLGKEPKLSKAHASPNRAFRYTSESILDGFEGEPLDGYRGSVYGVRVTLTTAATADTTWDFALNGVSFSTVTLDSGQVDSGFISDTRDFGEDDAFTVIQTDGEDAGANLVAYVYVTLDLDGV